MLAATNLTSLSSRRDDLSLAIFLSITNPASCLHHLLPRPRSTAVTSRQGTLQYNGLDHTKFTQDRPPVQSDTVPSCNMAFLTTRTGLSTVNVHPSHFTHVGRWTVGDFNN